MLVWLAIILGSIVLDQLTKYLTVFYLKPIDTLPIIEDVLHLTYVENPGAAFGMMKDQRWVFMTVSTVAIVGIFIYLLVKRPESRLECLSLSFIVGGGIGNMIDRFLLGYVIDMIDFRLINFAVFNVADSFVCVGAGMMMLWLVLSIIKETREEKARALSEAIAEPVGGAFEESIEGSIEESIKESAEESAEAIALPEAEGNDEPSRENEAPAEEGDEEIPHD